MKSIPIKITDLISYSLQLSLTKLEDLFYQLINEKDVENYQIKFSVKEINLNIYQKEVINDLLIDKKQIALIEYKNEIIALIGYRELSLNFYKHP